MSPLRLLRGTYGRTQAGSDALRAWRAFIFPALRGETYPAGLLRMYDGSQDGVWYPLNSLVLSPNKNPTDCVVLDQEAKSLIKILKDEGAQVIEADMPQGSYPDGKINCQTNIHYLKDNPDEFMGAL